MPKKAKTRLLTRAVQKRHCAYAEPVPRGLFQQRAREGSEWLSN
jgi:hypothetical protein